MFTYLINIAKRAPLADYHIAGKLHRSYHHHACVTLHANDEETARKHFNEFCDRFDSESRNPADYGKDIPLYHLTLITEPIRTGRHLASNFTWPERD